MLPSVSSTGQRFGCFLHRRQLPIGVPLEVLQLFPATQLVGYEAGHRALTCKVPPQPGLAGRLGLLKDAQLPLVLLHHLSGDGQPFSDKG